MFGGDTIEETSEDDDSDDVSTDVEPNDGGTTDGGDPADGAPKSEVSDGSLAGSVSGYHVSTEEGSPEGKYDVKVDVNKGLLKKKGDDGATTGAAFHVGLQTPVPVTCHSPVDHNSSPVSDTRRKLRRKLDYVDQIEKLEKLVKALTPSSMLSSNLTAIRRFR
jgi:hypothetical protein